MMRLRNRNFGILLIAICEMLAVSPATAGLSSKDITARGQEIEQMTAIERDRLQRNWKMFLALPEDRKHHFRELHRQLNEDQQMNNGQLEETLQTYKLWLQTLTPGERAELREAKDPNQKMDLVRKFKAQQDQRQESRVLDDPAYDPSQLRERFNFSRKKPRSGAKPLTSDELHAAMQALAAELPRNERDSLQAFDTPREKWTYYRLVLERSVRQAEGARQWPTQDQQEAVLAVISGVEQIERLKKIDQPTSRRMMFARLMSLSLSVQLNTDAAPFQPKERDLEALFEQLDHTEREKLMRRPAEDMPQALLRMFLSKNTDPAYLEFSKQRREFQESTRKLLREAQWSGGRFGGSPGGRPPFRPGDPPPDGDPGRPPRDRGGRPRFPDENR